MITRPRLTTNKMATIGDKVTWRGEVGSIIQTEKEHVRIRFPECIISMSLSLLQRTDEGWTEHEKFSTFEKGDIVILPTVDRFLPPGTTGKILTTMGDMCLIPVNVWLNKKDLQMSRKADGSVPYY